MYSTFDIKCTDVQFMNPVIEEGFRLKVFYIVVMSPEVWEISLPERDMLSNILIFLIQYIYK